MLCLYFRGVQFSLEEKMGPPCFSLPSLFLATAIVLSFLQHGAEAGCGSTQYWGVVSSSCAYNSKGEMDWDCKSCPAGAIQYCMYCPGWADQYCMYKAPPKFYDECLDEVCVCKPGYFATQQRFQCGPDGLYGSNFYTGNNGVLPPMQELFTCEPCPVGMYCPGGADTTNVVWYYLNGQTMTPAYRHEQPIKCPYALMISDVDHNGCTCPLGTDLVTIGTKLMCACPLGQYWDKTIDSKTVSCAPCPMGAYCNDGYNMTYCPKGWTTPGTGSSKLYQCSVCNWNTVCYPGEYCRAPTADDMEFSCPPCPLGHRCQDRQAVQCPAGTYQNELNRTNCKLCEAGTASSMLGRTVPCEPCSPGQYQDEKGQEVCKLSPAGKYTLPGEFGQIAARPCPKGTYQPDMGSTTCLSCPLGYAAKGSEADLGQSSLLGACEICGPGSYTSLQKLDQGSNVALAVCTKCPPGKYNPFSGQDTCIQCPGSDLFMTSPPGSTSVSQCSCDTQTSYMQTSSGLCLPCTTCGKGTYMTSSSSGCSETMAALSPSSGRCTACKTCPPMHYVHPDFLCTGTESRDKQLDGCTPCTPSSCSSGGSSSISGDGVMLHCYSGTGSVDTTQCVPQGFASIHESSCDDGFYLSPFSRFSATMPPTFQILPNAQSKVFAVMDPFSGAVDIWPSKSLDDAIVVAGGGGDEQQQQQPMMQYRTAAAASSGKVLTSCVWSLDGNILYVIRTDATIVLMQVFPVQYRQVNERWSVVDTFANVEKPYAYGSTQTQQSTCVSLPQQPVADGTSSSSVKRQMALICTFDSSATASHSAYLVRIQTDGSRLVDLASHSSTYASTGLLYDISLNVVYWTAFQTWAIPYSHTTEKKTVHRIVLGPTYDVSYIDWSFIAASSYNQTAHPLGISMEAASIEPGSNMLYAYLCYQQQEARLFRMPIIVSDDGSFVRSGSFLQLSEQQELYGYAGPVLQSIQSIASPQCKLPARFFFTMHGRLFLQMPFYGIKPGMNDVFLAGMCKPCPQGLTSDGRIAISADMCRQVMSFLLILFLKFPTTTHLQHM